MENKKISIIIPIYNAEHYLSRCVDSILAQTFTDFEILLVDDGSEDSSGKICDEYEIKDCRVKVFHCKNGGVSSARNIGLHNAEGEWVCFIDSDDVVTSTYLEDMFKAVVCNDSMIVSNYKFIGSDKPVIELHDLILADGDIVRYFVDNKVFALSAPYSKLYNMNVIKNNALEFPVGIQMGEDAIFIMKYLNKVRTVCIVNKCNYYVNCTEGSLSSKYYSFEREWECYNIWKKEMLTFLTKFGPIYNNPVQIAWENRIGDTFNRCLLCLHRSGAKISFIKKISCLRSIPDTDIKEYNLYYKPAILRRKFLKSLIVNHLYILYILVGKLDKNR